MEYIETELLNDRYRLALSFFPIALESLEIDGLGVYITGPRDARHLNRGDATGALEDIEFHARGEDAALVAMAKHLSRAGYPYRVIKSRGYSQGDWVNGIAYLDTAATGTPEEFAHAALDAALDQWAAWLWGDTYLLDIETRVVFTAPGYEPIEEWRTVYTEDTCAIIATHRPRRLDTLRDMAEHYGLNLAPYTMRERETA